MKILFLAFPHADLYKEIVKEMERKGHEVIVILDRLLRYDPYHCSSKLKSIKKLSLLIPIIYITIIGIK